MTHKYLILILFCTWGPPLRFIGCSRMDAKAIVNAICHENSAACLPWFIFCKHIIKDHPAVIGASSSFFPRQCLLWVPAIGWKEGAHIDVYTPPPHFFHALVTCKTEFYFACLIFYSSMEGSREVNMAEAKVKTSNIMFWKHVYLYLYKIVGLFDLCAPTPLRLLTLEGWALDMLTSGVKAMSVIWFGQDSSICRCHLLVILTPFSCLQR